MIRRFKLVAVAMVFICALVNLANAAAEKLSLASDFSDFSVNETYRGPVRKPAFRGRDRHWAKYRTAITLGVEAGANFAGKYSLVQFGCGAGCLGGVAVDLTTGHVLRLPVGGINNLDLDLAYRLDSRLMDARWVDNGRCVRQKFTITRGRFDRSEIEDIGPEDVCLEPDTK